MLEVILGLKNRERVLQFVFSKGEGYAKEIADFYDTSLDPVQKQLEKLELGGVLVSKTVGRTRLFIFGGFASLTNTLNHNSSIHT